MSKQKLESPWEFVKEIGEANYDAGHLWQLYATRLWNRIKAMEEVLEIYRGETDLRTATRSRE